MKGTRTFRAVAVSATAAILATVAVAEAASDVQCRKRIVGIVGLVKQKRTLRLSICLRTNNYDACSLDHVVIDDEETKLLNQVGGPGRTCKKAFDEGFVLADFAPASCAAEFNDCDVEVPAIASMADFAACLRCQQEGYDLGIRDVLGMPRPAPVDREDRKCARLAGLATARAVRQADLDVQRCLQGQMGPVFCPVSDAPATRLARALASLDRKVRRCRIDEGQAPTALVDLCGAAAANETELVACLAGRAKCLACRSANAVLQQSQDCAAFSGDPSC